MSRVLLLFGRLETLCKPRLRPHRIEQTRTLWMNVCTIFTLFTVLRSYRSHVTEKTPVETLHWTSLWHEDERRYEATQCDNKNIRFLTINKDWVQRTWSTKTLPSVQKKKCKRSREDQTFLNYFTMVFFDIANNSAQTVWPTTLAQLLLILAQVQQ